jgi:outer membrane protein assembly factor BamB
MYALNATTGKFVWVYSELAASGNLQPTWTPLFINSPSLGPVFYTNDFFDLVAINATNGKQIWLNYLTRESFGLPTYSSGYVYTGRMTNGIYVNNAASGQKVGFFNAGSEVASSIAVYNSRLYFGSYDDNVYCVGQSSNGTTYLGNPVTTPAPTETPAPTPTPNLTTPSPSSTPFMNTLYNGLNTPLGAALLIIIVIIIGIAAISAINVREIKKTKKP